jgi:hypothetical protein
MQSSDKNRQLQQHTTLQLPCSTERGAVRRQSEAAARREQRVGGVRWPADRDPQEHQSIADVMLLVRLFET